jgi:predicted nucleotidyltransferase
MMINKEWHLKNKMPKNATVEQRLQWHLKHEKHCKCRPMPKELKKITKGSKRRIDRKRAKSPPRTFKSLAATLRRHKAALWREYRIKELGIFGSYVRGEQRKQSDVDIVVDFHDVPDLLTFVRLGNELEEILKHKVDLVRKPVIRPELKERILSEAAYI